MLREELARELGKDPSTISRWYKTLFGVDKGKEPYAPEEVERLRTHAARTHAARTLHSAENARTHTAREENGPKSPTNVLKNATHTSTIEDQPGEDLRTLSAVRAEEEDARALHGGGDARTHPTRTLQGAEKPGTHAARTLHAGRGVEAKVDLLLAAVQDLKEKLDEVLTRTAIAPLVAPSAEQEASTVPPHKKASAPKETHPLPAWLPPGTVHLARFATDHGVKDVTALAQLKKGWITATSRPLHTGKTGHYVLPDQQAPLLTTWRRFGYRLKTCPACPHQVPEEGQSET